MPFFWCKFKDYTTGTIEAPDEEEVQRIALEKNSDNPIQHIYGTLPYPASPVIHNPSKFPPFCWNPHTCVGWGACPRSHACDD